MGSLQVIEKPKLYVGCGLTLAPQEFKDNVAELKLELTKHWRVLQFLGVFDGDPTDVYQRHIIENVGGCDAFLAVVDEPSTGLGMELGEATALGKPVLAVAQEDSKITRLLLGAVEFHKNLAFRRYGNMVEDVPGIAQTEFAHVLGRDAVQTVQMVQQLPPPADTTWPY